MSDFEVIIHLLKRMEKMLLQQTLLNKEVLNTKETALYLGMSVRSVYRLCKNGQLPRSKPNNGRLYFKRLDAYNWMLSETLVIPSDQQTEEEKLKILNP